MSNLEKNNQENLCLNKNLIRELFISKKNAAFFGKNLLEDEDSTDPEVIKCLINLKLLLLISCLINKIYSLVRKHTNLLNTLESINFK